jgi:hypothetical protein
VDRTSWPGGEIMRDVTRGGLAGLVVGIVVAGFGGRLAMRLAALVVPSANGAFTENGNRIGEITLAGSAALVIFAGLAAAIFLAVVWVAISPWLPGRGVVRGLVAMPIAVAFGATALINADNPDFVVLGHDPFVVAILLALVAAMAPAMAVADGWFDRRLPHAASITSPAGIVYAAMSAIGLAIGSLLVFQSIAGGQSQSVGVAIFATGLLTLGWWVQRLGGAAAPAHGMRVAGRTILVAGTGLGYAALAPELAGALGLG